MVEVMSNHERQEALIILLSASDLPLHTTNGMLVDGEACTLPQVEVKKFLFSSLYYKIKFVMNARC